MIRNRILEKERLEANLIVVVDGIVLDGHASGVAKHVEVDRIAAKLTLLTSSSHLDTFINEVKETRRERRKGGGSRYP